MSAPSVIETSQKPTWRETLRVIPRMTRIMLQADRKSFWLLFLAAVMELPSNAVYTLALKGIADAAIASNIVKTWIWSGAICGVLVWQALESYINERYSDELRYKVDLNLGERAMRVVAGQPLATLESPAYQTLYAAFMEKRYLVIRLQNELVWYSKRVFGLLGLTTMFFLLPWQAVVLVLVFQALLFFSRTKDANYAWQILDWKTREGRRGTYFERVAMGANQPLFSKLYGLFPVFREKWKALTSSILEKQLHHSHRTAWSSFLSQICTIGGFISGVYFLLPHTFTGTIVSIGGFIAFTTAYFRFSQWAASLMTEIDWMQQEAPGLVKIDAFLSLPVEADKGRVLPERTKLIVEFQNVWFRYPDSEQDILSNVSFTLAQGEHAALVGLNGAGKTTLLKLLFRVYRPTRGAILVNGIDLWSLRPSAWHKLLAVMTQAIPEFSDTLREQVLYGQYDEKPNSKRFKRATSASGFSDVSHAFTSGLQTMVGRSYAMIEDNAVELSGGQTQLLSIARTLYRDAKIYVFDEPTSAVDAEKEDWFFERLEAATPSKMVIFVSHRFSVLRRASRILVMDQGRIIEDGTHDELIAKAGRYAELFTLQAKMYQ